MKLSLKYSLVFILILLSGKVEAATFGMNDVSMLLPLPSPQGIAGMLSPVDGGAKGQLLPKDIYLRFPALDNRFDAQTLYDNNFKVIGIRIDPCFAEGTSTVCRKQIRLVWQPLAAFKDGTITLDAAVHSFYEFSDAEWAILLKKWARISKGNMTEGLLINPTLKQEGYAGPTWIALKKIVLESCGDKNLVRVTGMRLSAMRMWTFMGFDRINRQWTAMTIPRTSSTQESFVLVPEGLFDLNAFQGTLSPTPQGEELLLGLVTESRDFRLKRSESDAKTLMTHMIQFENPTMHNPGTVDCVSCHMAQVVRIWGEHNYSSWNWKTEFESNRFSLKDENLENNSVNPFNTNRVRAFGYFDADPILSQRVINETGLVVERLKAMP